jgi:hypothetical protein
MTPKVSQYLNKTVLVSIPALFDDGKCRAFTLVGVELHGLWLQSDEITERLLLSSAQAYATTAPVTFVPFAQIAGVLVGTRPPAAANAPASKAVAVAPKAPAVAPKAPAAAPKATSSAPDPKAPPGRKSKGS